MKHLTTILFTAAACTANETGASCPTADAPTYATFGQPFLHAYCTGCHSDTAPNRYGAPPDRNFDSEAEVRAQAADIDRAAAAGPDADNTDMPDLTGPVHAAPSFGERARLGQFLACERR
jgi:hypothetical protein